MRRPIKVALSLQDAPFFRELSEALREQIEGLVYHRDYEARQIVYFPDDPCDHVYWVREGRVRVCRGLGDGRELTYRHLTPGGLFGEECLVAPARRDTHAEAMEPAVLCLMRANDFQRIAAESAELAMHVARRLAARAMQTEQVLAECIFQTASRRVAAGLHRLWRQAGEGQAALRITHQELANLVGTTRETTTQVLHALRTAGILKISNRRVAILDPAALEHWSRSAQ